MASESEEISDEENGNNSRELATFLNFGGNFLIFKQL